MWLIKAALDNADGEAMHDTCELAMTGTVTHMPLGTAWQPLVRFQQTPDYDAAFRCFGKYQAKYGGGWEDEAPFYIGYLYHRGLGTRRDDKRAIELLQPIADGSGEFRLDAQYELSLIYSDSPTIQHDLEKAYVLLGRAASYYGEPQVGCFISYRQSLHLAHQRNAAQDLRAELVYLRPRLSRDQQHAADLQLEPLHFDSNGYAPIPPEQVCVD